MENKDEIGSGCWPTDVTYRHVRYGYHNGDVVHATVRDNNPHSTLCGARPDRNTLVSLTTKPLTCWECEEILDDDEDASNYDRDPREPW